MPEDVGGKPFPDGEDHGGADDEFASVVFDEAFVRAATLHEPTAHERLLAAAQALAEADAARTRIGGAEDDGLDDETLRHDGYRPGRFADDADQDHFGGYGRPHRHAYRSHTRWHRTIAWVLALVMGIGVIALTFVAVYRGAGGGGRQPAPLPATGRVDTAPPQVRVASSTGP
ncbi:hypothetical protein [Streptantibioticus ferralitis]|uniref:Uncharacterized protein n=1 Tax=Streptantibioticus ferralitis TaxID=236510 RepID=A0ABT5Z2R5_9ACTN|nr:hypothetical protein [Streptantibioticus ferralitis]MDF2258110.1 hypothetical protein [Streptantibioticus ferralitis]